MNWTEELNVAITVCDENATIHCMNAKAAQTFSKYGGKDLIGHDLLACHSPQSQARIRELMSTQQSNVYTIEKNGVRKMIYQTPWFEGGQFKGLVELSLELPAEIPHFVR